MLGQMRYLRHLIIYERYIPVMTPDELRMFGDGNVHITPATVRRWQSLLKKRQDAINARFDAAYKRQKELCKQNKVK